ncbi:uncharacterized protein Triagg1_2045 [Trichoderma aggressivum f. europaeum]|uniref:Ribosomal protein bL31m N-terminal domain-containing protein n=1 Tax=Trichoderma aggressivum f. europaeum TaxID=173218 RepID=A0AAE1M8A5_9HYPO|nr:hypothetical protein Triagg1_2045 [Trichoderma aggressivum f. europaeum]
MGKLPVPSTLLSSSPLRPSTTSSLPFHSLSTQTRNATFIPRPRRPYTFTQLIQLSDGSTYTARTTSPLPLYRAQKDTRNTLLWQPSEKSLRNVELDEAGKLAAFRERFGRGYDATAQAVEGAEEGEKAAEEVVAKPVEEDTGLNFEDLLAEYTPQDTSAMKDSGPKRSPTRRK